MSDTREYKCANCGAPLAFDAATQSLSCANCGSTFTVESLAEAWQSVADGIKDEDQEFSWGSLESAMPQETLSEMALYTCQSCGAEIEADLNTAATRCPYCDNNVVLTGRVTDALKPNGIIPFKSRAFRVLRSEPTLSR